MIFDNEKFDMKTIFKTLTIAGVRAPEEASTDWRKYIWEILCVIIWRERERGREREREKERKREREDTEG